MVFVLFVVIPLDVERRNAIFRIPSLVVNYR